LDTSQNIALLLRIIGFFIEIPAAMRGISTIPAPTGKRGRMTSHYFSDRSSDQRIFKKANGS
jgi:hypothetical protein